VKKLLPLFLVAILAAVSFSTQAAGFDMQGFAAAHADIAAGLSMLCVGNMDVLMKSVDALEKNISAQADKANGEFLSLGKVSQDTKTAIDTLGTTQRELADRMLQLEQKSVIHTKEGDKAESYGEQFIKNAHYINVKANASQQFGRVSLEVKNTVTNAIGNTYSQRVPGLVEGAFRVFTIEDLLTTIPANANAIDWVRENVFTNAAAETTEGTILPQSSITFTPGTMPVQNVGHFLKITRQLAMDNAALAAYINRRMIYGVNYKVEAQLVAGNGTTPNLSGLTQAGNFTAHGYTSASLTALGLSPTNRFDLIGKMCGDCALADFPSDVVLLNTADWWTMRLSKDSTGEYLLGDPSMNIAPSLFGRPVVASNAMAAGNVWVGSLSQAATLHNREGVVIDLSDSDENNFQLGLVSIRAMRRLALTVEKPAAARYGALQPA
jgi:HK97 family phage major capsid protein